MTTTQVPNRLHKQLADIVALEAAIEKALAQLVLEVSGYPEVAAMFREFHTMTKNQLYALDSRLQAIGENVPIPDRTTAILADIELMEQDGYPVSSALQTTYILFNHAVIGYAKLQVISIRFRDSWVVAEEGTTAHLARQHTQNYASAINQVCRLFHDVVVWELDQEGFECRCICPGCSLGVCLGAAASRVTLRDAWDQAVPIVPEEGVFVQNPRKGSAAASAGLRRGDVVEMADGQGIQSVSDLQTAIRAHQSGEGVQLKVRRGSDELMDITLLRP